MLPHPRIAQRLDSIYVTRFFYFAKITNSVPRPFAHRGTTEEQTFQQKSPLFFDCKSNSSYKHRLLDRCHIHSFHSSFTRGKLCTHANFLWSLVPPEKLSDTWPSILTYVNLLVSWCFEPSQPQRITSGLKTNFKTNCKTFHINILNNSLSKHFPQTSTHFIFFKHTDLS